uniref:Reverse transcriptase domain-containing protein n=1 Tax=Anolis carolinensis TaxID=28377 RepID=A0A803TIM4_ANOCA
MDLLDIVLEKNYFRFQNQFYFQTFGVAMGSPLAPSIANLFMAHLENTILLNPSLNMYYSNIIYYGRFIDDIFIVFKTTEAAVGFSNWINTIHTSIKFTSHLNLSHINFLDVTVYKHHNKLLVKNFRKPSDKNSFLHYNSFHHFGLKTNLPFSQLLRLKRNSSSNEHFIHESLTLSQEFRSRGYPKHVIKKALIKAEKTDRTTLLKESAKPTKNQIIWTQELSHYSKHIIQIIKKHWHLLQDISGCDKLPIFGNRRTKNISRQPYHSNLSELERTTLVKLSNLKEVVWKPADKGGAIVLLNKRDYIKEVNLQLSNSKFYQPIATDPTKHIQSLIRVVCQEGLSMGFISSSTFKYLQNDFPRIPIFYILPKIHKGIIPLPGRPIISGSSSVLEPVAKYLDSFCQPFVSLCDSYIKDTKHFINIVENLKIEE